MSTAKDPQILEKLSLFRHKARKYEKSEAQQSTDDKRINNVEMEDIYTKIIDDIDFLQHRIAQVKNADYANKSFAVLQSYESMLASRESVLNWLHENKIAPVSMQTQKTGTNY
ncbi:MAG: hypothetical protein COA42_21935 [Alteromonadaceae bacterium]|nr:MAG: hypothetical protein COA42_21935 [Alteromonadaceae bacterium]